MSHPNRFPSSPSLRGSSKQAANELHLTPMPRPKSSTSHVAARRFFSRRPHPSVASIADLFVGSLILAGYCHEHSPRARSLSMVSSRAPGRQFRNYHSGGFVDLQTPPAPKHSSWKNPGSSWPQLSQHQSRLSSATARAEHEYAIEEDTRRVLEKNDEKKDENASADSNSLEDTDKKLQATLWNHYFDADTPNPTSNPNDEPLPLPDEPPPMESHLSYDERRYLSTASLYRKILGEHFDWKEAVKLVLPNPQARRLAPGDPEIDTDSPSVAMLIASVHAKPKMSSQYLFGLYRQIPAPGVAKLPPRTRGYLLRQLANPPNRRSVDCRRYLALVEDMIACRLPMSLSMWTTAISFAGRASKRGHTKKRYLIRAIGLWQQMEHYAKITADDAVFNTLYDTAVKSGQFSIAERLDHERIKRGIPATRYGLIPKLNYYAEHRDLEGISNTFNEFIQSGNMVDTVVLNGLISAFLRAGDFQTAEGVYKRMLLAQMARKGDHSNVTGNSLSTQFEVYRATTKRVGRLLKLSHGLKDKLPGHHSAIQESLSLTPDTRTFHILLRHYAITTGRFEDVLRIVRDMERTYRVPPRHMIYNHLFEGFSLHGAAKKKIWTPERLRLTWFSYIRALHDSKHRHDALLEAREDTIFGDQIPSSTLVKLRKTAWDNPFADEMAEMEENNDSGAVDEQSPANEAQVELYMPLPSPVVEPSEDAQETLQERDARAFTKDHAHSSSPSQPSHPEKDVPEKEFNADEYLRTEFLLNSKHLDKDLQAPEREHATYLETRLENGVFIGRQTIIYILRAFGTCMGPHEVVEVWGQLEHLWDPIHRQAVDVAAVKEELDRQLEKYGMYL
ncbi:hypothetical protein N7532_000326 [Penicillium argentinense]|uniref:Pentatricopeptide repeat protein n=1 Tax=Penicillium argentinense TaxID=1131581 RepID=A0A9W9G5A9_9EURO|nr:uncharacterized protein N7532_000326 [Penicillium argentinense]KAJ5112281.1 hypothetical protein N7532_000326 [Penicillium argentinense]